MYKDKGKYFDKPKNRSCKLEYSIIKTFIYTYNDCKGIQFHLTSLISNHKDSLCNEFGYKNRLY